MNPDFVHVVSLDADTSTLRKRPTGLVFGRPAGPAGADTSAAVPTDLLHTQRPPVVVKSLDVVYVV